MFLIEIAPNFGTEIDERHLCNTNSISDPIETSKFD